MTVINGINGASDGRNGIGGLSNHQTPDPAAHAGNKQHLKHDQIELNKVPAYTSRRLRVVTIGAGYSGLTLAHKFQHQHSELNSVIDHTIYEARFDLGGTWLVNTYPGVICDVPSHIYVNSCPLYCLRRMSNPYCDYTTQNGVGSSRLAQRYGST
jgi:NAD(P)-binding Rossmann-like domain